MKKNIIAIWGRSKQGKSTTVKNITKLILEKYSIAQPNPLLINYDKDIKLIITIGETKIGIESQGDPKSRLFESLNEFSKKKCDLIICSTRTSGETAEAVKALTKSYGYEITWATNYRSNEKDEDILNKLSATQIFELFKELLDSKI